MRQIVLDTETTGLNPKKGDRIVEIGCIEMIDRKLTGRSFHYYLNPERNIPEEVIAVHGITNEQVKDAPKFRDIAVELWSWLEGAELIIHNAVFDMNFLNAEYKRFAEEQAELFQPLETACSVLDTLKLAREKHPGSKLSLDALCKRYGIDNSHRTLHGALLDSEILADVYLLLTGGQVDLLFSDSDSSSTNENETDLSKLSVVEAPLVTVLPSPSELEGHRKFMNLLSKKSGIPEIQWPGES